VQDKLSIILQAVRLVDLAWAERFPNAQLHVRPYYDFGEREWQLKVEAGMPVPLFNRNQGNFHAARADLARAQHELHQVELRLLSQLTAAFQRQQSALAQKQAYENHILRRAREALDLVRQGYERGDAKYDYAALLQAERTLAQAGLDHVQALAELAKATSEIAGLVQRPTP
jgi:cobalt-zinc-cadmium efflux system outer membrane protein